jgi:hypothetical protein
MSFFSGILKGLGGIASGALTGALGGVAANVLGNAFKPRSRPAQQTADPMLALRQESAMRAYNAADPRAMTDARVRAALMQRAMLQGRAMAGRLRDSGAGSSAQMGAMIDQSNQATSGANDYLMNMYSPESLFQGYMNQGSALDALANYQRGGQINDANLRLSNAQIGNMRGPSVFESLIGIAGQTAPYWIDSVLKSPTAPAQSPMSVMAQSQGRNLQQTRDGRYIIR